MKNNFVYEIYRRVFKQKSNVLKCGLKIGCHFSVRCIFNTVFSLPRLLINFVDLRTFLIYNMLVSAYKILTKIHYYILNV